MNAQPYLQDATRCPLCHGDNRCAMERERATGLPQEICWCVVETFPPALMAALPAEAAGKACICAACVRKFVAQGAPT
ncbi:MAG: cysteine-rich CWC family protein [Hydrogenophaga sp.]